MKKRIRSINLHVLRYSSGIDGYATIQRGEFGTSLDEVASREYKINHNPCRTSRLMKLQAKFLGFKTE